MATKKTVKAPEDQVFYAVIPDKYPIENNEDIKMFTTIEQAFFDAQDAYDIDLSKDKYIVYELKKKGIVNMKVDIELS